MAGRTEEGNFPVLEIDMVPAKTNQFGERKDNAVLVADGRHPKAFAGLLILAMVAQDEVGGDQRQVPLRMGGDAFFFGNSASRPQT